MAIGLTVHSQSWEDRQRKVSVSCLCPCYEVFPLALPPLLTLMKTSLRSTPSLSLLGCCLAIGMALLQWPASGQVSTIGKDWTYKNPVASTITTGVLNGTGETLNAVAARVSVNQGSIPANRPALPGLCIAVGNNGEAATAVNGNETWVRHATGSTYNLNAIVYPLSPASAANVTPPAPYEMFTAVGEHGTVATTKDGVTWVLSNVGGASQVIDNLTRLIWNGLQFIALAEGAPAKVYTSPGVETTLGSGMFTWTVHTASTAAIRDLIWSEPSGTSPNNSTSDVYVGLKDSGYVTSPDGITWTAGTFPANFPSTLQPKSITWNNARKFIVVGTSPTGPAVFEATSLTGTWADKSPTTFGATRVPDRIISFEKPYGSQDVMISLDQRSNSVVMTGTSTGFWDDSVVSPSSGAAPTPAVSWKGATRVPGGVYILVGEMGRIFTGGNITNSWTIRYSSGTTDSLLSAVSTHAQVAVSSAGEMLRSTDGTYWSKVTSPTAAALRDVIWNGQQFMAVGDAGTILTSPDGNVWTVVAPSASLVTAAYSFQCVIWTGSVFLVGGGSDEAGGPPRASTWTRSVAT